MQEQQGRTEQDLLFKVEVYQIIGCAMEVLNSLGNGLLEKPYENAMVVEFGRQKIPCQKQKHYPVFYKTVQVGDYVPDLIAYDQVIVEIKTVAKITDFERGQVINYLKITGLRVGLILNFKYAKLQWERIIL